MRPLAVLTSASHAFTRLLVASLLFTSLGCAHHVRFAVVRPAMLDASEAGNTFDVRLRSGRPDAVADIENQLRDRFARSLNPSIRLVGAGGAVLVTGDVSRHDASEELYAEATSCNRTESYRDPRTGRNTTRTVSYPCTRFHRNGSATLEVRFQIFLVGSNRMIFERVYARSTSDRTTGNSIGGASFSGPVYEGSIPYGAVPPPLNFERWFAQSRGEVVAEFAQVVLPWEDEVDVEFTDCGSAEGCDEAISAIEAGDLEGAEAIYTEILRGYDNPALAVAPEDMEIVYDTLFNRGILRAYLGSFELALQDLNRAVELAPDEDLFRRELANIDALAEESDTLRRQMEVGETN
jgi:tetratricopeptide (TPR) repeat protein